MPCKPITAYQLAESFPDEVKQFAPGKIAGLSRKLSPYKKQIQAIRDNPEYDEFTKYFLVEAVKMFIPRMETEYREKLKTALSIITGKISAANEMQIQRAKAYPITDIHSFSRARKFNGKIKALCPFHDEKTPSFIIYPTNTFYCWGCHASGDAIKFFMLVKKTDFKNAVAMMQGGNYE